MEHLSRATLPLQHAHAPRRPQAQPVAGELLQRAGADAFGGQGQPLLGQGVGADHPAVFGQGQQPFADAAQPLGQRVQAHDAVAGVAGVEEPVFDHARGRAHQGKGVRVVATVVAGDVKHAAQLPARAEDWRGRAGQEAVALKVVLGAVDDDGAAFGQAGADGVGAAVAFMPEGAGAQRDALGAAQEVGVAQAVQQQAACIGEHHQAARVAHLVENEVHDGAGLREEVVFGGHGAAQLAFAAKRGLAQASQRADAGVLAALPGALQGFVHQAQRQVAGFQQAAAGVLQLG